MKCPAQHGRRPPLWRIILERPMSDPGGIGVDQTIVLGDFGLGSDTPIVLDYRLDA